MFLIFLFVIIFIAIDQISKYFVVTKMTLGESITVINNFFFITSHRNKGAAWGILQDSRLFFILVTILFLIAVFIYIFKTRQNLNKFDCAVFSLIIGGAIGNFIDRLKSGEVVDFLDFNIIGYNFPIFNFADTFICIGALLLAIKIYRED